MTDKDRYLIAELEKRLLWYRDEATEEEFDAEEVDAICVMLQKLSPVEEPRMSKEEAYRNILRRVQEEDGVEEADGFGETEDTDSPDRVDGTGKTGGTVSEFEKEGEKKKRYFFGSGRLRAAVLFVTVFGAALLSLNMVTYAREDKSLFTMILERVGVIEIVKEDENEKYFEGDDKIKTFYNSWTELNSKVKSQIIVPQYIPSGYELYGINYYDLNNRKRMRANYYNKSNGHLLISVVLWEDNADQYREMVVEENGYVLIPGYSDENTLYYAYEDEYICMTSMGNSFYRISGNIALEEMIKIREGLKV